LSWEFPRAFGAEHEISRMSQYHVGLVYSLIGHQFGYSR
jgi:hypothetical protein